MAGFGNYEKYPTLASKAGALLYALVKDHPCPLGGNKRLAFVLTVTFLAKNMLWLWADPEEVIERIDSVAASDAKQADAIRADLSQWLESHMLGATEALVLQQAGWPPGERP